HIPLSPEIYTLSLHDALPISLLAENRAVEQNWKSVPAAVDWYTTQGWLLDQAGEQLFKESADLPKSLQRVRARLRRGYLRTMERDRKSTRLNSSHVAISYAVF